MKRAVASLAAALGFGALIAFPALSQETKKTELVELGGKSVDSLNLRYKFEGTWVIDTTHILLRDTFRDHYYITLKAPCDKLDMKRDIGFTPALIGRLRAGVRYEVRDAVGAPCDIARVEQIADDKATALKASLAGKS